MKWLNALFLTLINENWLSGEDFCRPFRDLKEWLSLYASVKTLGYFQFGRQ